MVPGKKDGTLHDKPIPLPSMIHDTGAWAEIHCSHYLTGPAHLYKLSNMGVPTDTIGLPGTSVTGQLTEAGSLICLVSGIQVHSGDPETDASKKSGMEHKEGRNATL